MKNNLNKKYIICKKIVNLYLRKNKKLVFEQNLSKL